MYQWFTCFFVVPKHYNTFRKKGAPGWKQGKKEEFLKGFRTDPLTSLNTHQLKKPCLRMALTTPEVDP